MLRSLRLAALAIAAPIFVYSQSTFGTILGTVTDSTGAVVPSARVVITNEHESISREVTTDAAGNYEALNLKAGAYTVATTVSGFKSCRSTLARLCASMSSSRSDRWRRW